MTASAEERHTSHGVRRGSRTLRLCASGVLQIVYRRVSDLSLGPTNPRVHSDRQIRQIAESIRAFGFNVPVLIDSKERVIAGHGRLLACPLVGIKEVPTIMLDNLTETQARAFMIADNRLTENAAWDDRLLAEQLKALSEVELDFSLEATGFEVGEIDLMIEGLSPATKGEQDTADEFPDETNKVQVSRLHDLWQLDKHRVLCADATEPPSYGELMAGQKAAVAFIDPPHNVRIDGHATGLCKTSHSEFRMPSAEMTEFEFTDFLTSALTCLAANCIDGAIAYVCMDWRHLMEQLTAGRRVNLELKNLCVWEKDNAAMGSFYRSQHELIFVFKSGKGPHRNNGRYRTNVWHYPGANSFSRTTDDGNVLARHPTVKPVAMVADAIMDCSARGDIVLDGFLGSGTTVSPPSGSAESVTAWNSILPMWTPSFDVGRLLPVSQRFTRHLGAVSTKSRRTLPMDDGTKFSDYQVGFGKPPAATRFKKGRSGNPKGRPKGKPNAATAILRAPKVKVVINENGRRREVTKFEAAMTQLANKAAGGDLKALNLATTLTRLAEERIQEEFSTKTRLEDADKLVLQGLMQRLEATTEGNSDAEDGSEPQTD